MDDFDVSPGVAETPEAKKEKEDAFGKADPSAMKVNGARVYGVCLILFGIGSVLVLLPLFQEWDNYNNIKAPLDEGGSPFAYELNLPFFLFGTGAGLLIAGVLSLVAYCNNSRVFGYAAIALTLAAVGVQIYACVTISTTLESLRVKLEGNPVTNTFSDGEKSVMDFTGAVFNTCCLPLYDSRNYTFGGDIGQLKRESGGVLEDVDDNQRPVGPCKNSLEDTCPSEGANRMFPDIINKLKDVAGNLFEVLCHCYSDEKRFNKFVDILERDDLCVKYREIIVPNADDREVPTTSLTFSTLMTALVAFRPEYSDQLPIGKFAMVGKILPPKQVYNEPTEEIGYSCGLGYAKADAYYMYLFIDDHTKITVIGGIVLAALAGAESVILLLFWLSGGGGVDDEVMEYGYDEINLPTAPQVVGQQAKQDIDV